jgi:hypothetical protein
VTSAVGWVERLRNPSSVCANLMGFALCILRAQHEHTEFARPPSAEVTARGGRAPLRANLCDRFCKEGRNPSTVPTSLAKPHIPQPFHSVGENDVL